MRGAQQRICVLPRQSLRCKQFRYTNGAARDLASSAAIQQQAVSLNKRCCSRSSKQCRYTNGAARDLASIVAIQTVLLEN
ncbi:hypothetical protein DPMN_180805 [Dreissena polymorpha]|uniref:Uncharacterized protein n=1 Tax=Dreissena polymorpha TaxID=45954 RepID=A0A9D4DD19_DREPO|nr:hypothetical protein DPMN_180805 [Dreissena polymorpha]